MKYLFKFLARRLYNDFFRPSREMDYEKILIAAKRCGYEVHTILSFEDVIREGVNPEKKYLILRRDIDTGDFYILRKMLNLEKKYGARATYYFRWNTINLELMHDIAEAGGEASYHYEEIATYCYRHRITSKERMLEHMPEIRNLFVEQYARFKEETGQPCLTIASHGDYMNTRFKFQNYQLINDEVREKCGFIREAYDSAHMKALTCRIADQNELETFTDKSIEAMKRGEPVLELLTHPRQWNSPFWINLKEEINRVCKQLYMR